MIAKAHGFTKLRSSALALNAAASRAQVSGFTLIELMVVVVIMGVLAALATFGVRKYVLEAKKAEAASMITQIRAAEEAYRDETFAYLGIDAFDEWHPVDEPGAEVYSWERDTNLRRVVFGPLGVQPTGGVHYSYSVAIGLAGDSMPALPTTRTFDFADATGPFYIVMAKADLNGDGTFTYALSHSDTSTVHIDDTL
jgi:prepilin-type N-terminal cleavage/methylation domain-containing protein